MPCSSTDGQQRREPQATSPILPSRCYWWSLGLLPLVAVGAWISSPASWWWFLVPGAGLLRNLAVTALVLGAVLGCDPHVRRMPTGWRLAWMVGGSVVSTFTAGFLLITTLLVAQPGPIL